MYKLLCYLAVIRSHNSHDRLQIYHTSNSAGNHTINELNFAIAISFKITIRLSKKKKKILKVYLLHLSPL